MKPSKACRQCRESKRKCTRSSHRVGAPCQPCQRRNMVCASSLTRLSSAPSSLLPRPGCRDIEKNILEPYKEPGLHVPDVSLDIATRLVNYYLDRLHNRPHSLFHAARLRHQVQDGSINRALLLAILSLASRFDEDDRVRNRENDWMVASKRLLLADLENICIENVQTSILIANLHAAHLDAPSEALFFRLAISLMQIMELGISPSESSLIDREVKRRTWWTLYMADRWSSSSLGLPRQIQCTEHTVDLPMNETLFDSLSFDETRLHSPWRPGLWAHMISLVEVFGPIQDLNRRSAYGNITSEELETSIDSLSKKLDNWECMLPLGVKMSEANIQRHIKAGNGGAFIALHLGYHHYATLLYFRFLEPLGLVSASVEPYHRKCKFHAFAFSHLVSFARQNQGCEVIYPTVGHMAVVSSSVLLHTLLFGEQDDIKSARDALNANFAAILELRRFWSNTAPMINRLVTFQKFCLLSTDYKTHKLDSWMIRFLIEYSLPLTEKDIQPVTLGIDMDLDGFSTRTEALTEQGRYTSFSVDNSLFEST